MNGQEAVAAARTKGKEKKAIPESLRKNKPSQTTLDEVVGKKARKK